MFAHGVLPLVCPCSLSRVRERVGVRGTANCSIFSSTASV
ncbi:hypothetical protein [Polaromonas sp. CG9_12]|nr:hypothetical protein [Polaromonas sp. CG9_12]